MSTTIKDALAFLEEELRAARKEEHPRGEPNTQREDKLIRLRDYLKHMINEPPHITLHRHGNSWSCENASVSAPVLERCANSSTRLVIENIDLYVVDFLRCKHALAIVPAPLDATEAIVRATHALAGATIELSNTLRAERERK